jgi:hypothetical protein
MVKIRRFALHTDERGQMAIAFMLSSLFFFMFFALGLDAGLWYFDHRSAQGQAEAAALAAAQELPASNTSAASAKAAQWLSLNGAGSPSSCGTAPAGFFSDPSGTQPNLLYHRNGSSYDKIKVCVRRNSLPIFSKLTNVGVVRVSAAAVATAGPVSGTNVMPWSFAAFDRSCDAFGKMCNVDLNGNGVLDAGESAICTFASCPFGLDPNRLAAFKNGGNGFTIRACGSGANDYRDCITGAATSSGFTIGSTVTVDVQPGVQSGSSATALDTWASNNGDAAHACNVQSTPDPANGGLDSDVVNGVLATRLNTPACDYRKVVVPLMCYTPASSCVPPNGSSTLTVLGLAVFYVAGWDSKAAAGTTSIPCTQYDGGSPPAGRFDCGAVWGYLLLGIDPAARFKLDKLCDPATQNCNNPLAPILVVLTE